MQRSNKRNGFTLIELITVIALIGVLALVAFPAVSAYLESGRQTNRTNVARTLYVAAQNRLTELRTTGSLRSTLTEKYYVAPGSQELDPDSLAADLVASRLGGGSFADAENSGLVCSLGKPRGETDPSDPLIMLLDPVVTDKSILGHAIHIEYNIKTGVVLSVFYSENADELVYSDILGERCNIMGDRPYKNAAERRQGYYGVDGSGQPTQVELPDIAEIRDGAATPLDTPLPALGRELLYSEVLIPRTESGTAAERTLSLCDIGGNELYSAGLVTFPTITGSFETALANTAFNNGHLFYFAGTAPAGSVVQYGVDLSAAYDRYIWVVDYVGGNQLSGGQPHSIKQKYGIDATELRLRVAQPAGGNVLSLSKAHSLYLAELGTNSYSVSSARHLSNLRYCLDGDFVQTADISMETIENFEPIEGFGGSYMAVRNDNGSYTVSGLQINSSSLSRVGLFGLLDGGQLHGLSLWNYRIDAAGAANVGALAGSVQNGGRLTLCSGFGSLNAGGAAVSSTGGLVGLLGRGCLLEQCYNGGYFDATGRQPYSIGAVTADRGNIGGLVGESYGTVQNSYNNARVNIASVTVESTGTDAFLSKNPVSSPLASGVSSNLGGIVGFNRREGQLLNLYATNHVGSYNAPSQSGGVAGVSLGSSAGCYYIDNGVVGGVGEAKSKAELQTLLTQPEGSAFDVSGATYRQGSNTAADYPYPVLRGNGHRSGYEDIWEQAAFVAPRLAYYEYYGTYADDGKQWGYRSSDGTVNTLRSTLPLVNDGYCLELGYASSYEIILQSRTAVRSFVLQDLANSSQNPDWEWAGNNTMPLLPVAIAGADPDGRTMRLFLDNTTLEGLSDYENPIEITVKARGIQLLRQNFNPLFAHAFGSGRNSFTVRSPRHLDNIDRIAVPASYTTPPLVDKGFTFTQTADLDFDIYFKELQQPGSNPATRPGTRLNPDGSVVNARFNSEYYGKQHYIRNLSLSASYEYLDSTKLIGMGLFAELGGLVDGVVLLQTDYSGQKLHMGGITGVVNSGGRIQSCELSEVTLSYIGSASAEVYVGGVAGLNNGQIRNVYFNSTLTDNRTGAYTSPITGSALLGGLVGDNRSGSLSRSYTTSVAPNGNPSVGLGMPGDSVFYLATSSYNAGISGNQGIALPPEASSWEGKLGGDWETSTLDTTKETYICDGIAYPYPKLKDTDHYFDWPVLVTTFKYYERYDDLSYGYHYYLTDTLINTLQYDPDRTVIEEGYLVDVLTGGRYAVRLDGVSPAGMDSVTSVIMDNRRVIKLPNELVEPLAQVGADGLRLMKVEVLPLDGSGSANELETQGGGTVWFNPLFANCLALTDSPEATPARVRSGIEVRSPRHLININAGSYLLGFDYHQTCSINMDSGTASTTTEDTTSRTSNDRNNYGEAESFWNPTPQDMPAGCSFTSNNNRGVITSAPVQNTVTSGGVTTVTTTWYTISVRRQNRFSAWYGQNYFNNEDPARTDYTTTSVSVNSGGEDSSRLHYSLDQSYSDVGARSVLSPFGKNIVSGSFAGSYDAAYAGNRSGALQSDTRRLSGYRIYNIIMNVKNSGSINENRGGLFAEVAATAKIQNLELVDPQLRYEKNGGGGGTVTPLCYGELRNIRVYNRRTSRSLFAGADGTTDDGFCGVSRQTDGYAHVHGAIAGVLDGASAGVWESVVGTTSSDVMTVANNQTQIHCAPESRYTGLTERDMILMGGIVGEVINDSRVVSCINIATITADISNTYGGSTPHNIGGIVGRTGGAMLQTNTTRSYVIGCYNAGSVRVASGWVAGVAGRVNGFSSILSCYNTGRVNIENNSAGEIIKTQPASNALRIGGISAEVNAGATFSSCYNIGYVSDVTTAMQESASGAILALPAYGNLTMSNVYSLAADKYRPVGIVGKVFSGGSVNGITDVNVFDTWETRANLRNNVNLTTYDPADNLYPFVANPASFYIYPEFQGYGEIPANYHITPWEYIDAVYDTTVKYYEVYADGTLGEYYLTRSGYALDNLQDDSVVLRDGYLLEIGQSGQYRVEINDSSFDVQTMSNALGVLGKNVIFFSDEMMAACQPGYNRIRLFTRLVEFSGDTMQNREDDRLNRVVGTRSTLDEEGLDLYIDPLFPRELAYSVVAAGGSLQPPSVAADHSYAVRSPRHLDSIGRLAALPGALTTNRRFAQETDLDMSAYRYYDLVAPEGYSLVNGRGIYAGAPVGGAFAGNYDGGYHTISGFELQSSAPSAEVGLFALNNGTVQKLKLSGTVLGQTAAGGAIGTVAARNNGELQHIALESPTVSGSDGSLTGGLAGYNSGRIFNCYLVDNDSGSPVLAGEASSVGGLVGQNAGTLSNCYYLALSPGQNPICGSLEESGKVDDSVYYLAGEGYNDLNECRTGGIAKSTAQLTFIRDNHFVNGWGAVAGYPYPALTDISPTTGYPTAQGITFGLGYYEQYGADDYGWYFGEDDNTLNDSKPILAFGYAVLVPREGSDYLVRTADSLGRLRYEQSTARDFGGRIAVMPAMLTFEPNTPTAGADMLRVTVNGFDSSDSQSYCNPAFAKALGSGFTPLGILYLRTPAQLMNISDSTTNRVSFELERDLDFDAIDLNHSAVTGVFLGSFNGQNHSISNLRIDAPDTDRVGLFSVNSGMISNLTLNGNLSVSGNDYVGSLAGENLYAIANVNINPNAPAADGSGRSLISGHNYIAGIAGANGDGSYSAATVSDSSVSHLLVAGETAQVIAETAVDLSPSGGVTNCTITDVQLQPRISTLAVLRFSVSVTTQTQLPLTTEDNDTELTVDLALPEQIELPLGGSSLDLNSLLFGISGVQRNGINALLGSSNALSNGDGSPLGSSGIPPGISNIAEGWLPREVTVSLDDLLEGYTITEAAITCGNQRHILIPPEKLLADGITFVATHPQPELALTLSRYDPDNLTAQPQLYSFTVLLNLAPPQ